MFDTLHLFGYNLNFSSDDISIPSVWGGFLKACYTIGLAIIIIFVFKPTNTCDFYLSEDIGFFTFLLAINLGQFILYAQMFRVSTTGTILKWKHRHHVMQPLIHFQTAAYISQIWVSIWGSFNLSIRLSAFNTPCTSLENSLLSQMYVFVVVGSFIDFFGALCLFLVLVITAKKGLSMTLSESHAEDNGNAEKMLEPLIRKLFRIFQKSCCGLFGSLKSPGGMDGQVFREVSLVVHSFIKGFTENISPTDLIAALILLRAQQKEWQLKKEGETRERIMSSTDGIKVKGADIFPNSNPLSNNSYIIPTNENGSSDSKYFSKEEAFKNVEDFLKFESYMQGIYGWKLYMYSKPGKFLFKTYPSLCLGNLLNCFGTMEEKIFKMTVHEQSKILYSSWTDYMGESIPYLIAIDHKNKAVVVVCRGTMSVGDILTDLACSPESLDIPGRQWGFDGKKHYAHGGMLAVAMKIRADIERQQILHRIFRKDEEYGNGSFSVDAGNIKNMGGGGMDDMFDRESYINERDLNDLANVSNSYRLIVTGHSLGACMASILSLLLRPKFPHLETLAYSPAASVFSYELAQDSEKWIKSIFLGKDAFARLNWKTAKQVRIELLKMLYRSKTNKATVLLSLVKRFPLDALLEPEDYDHQRHLSLQSKEEITTREAILEKIRILSIPSETLLLDKIPLHMPGKLLHIVKISKDLSTNERKYVLAWVKDRTVLGGIQMSSRLILDHMPDVLVERLKKIQNENREVVMEQGVIRSIASNVDV